MSAELRRAGGIIPSKGSACLYSSNRLPASSSFTGKLNAAGFALIAFPLTKVGQRRSALKDLSREDDVRNFRPISWRAASIRHVEVFVDCLLLFDLIRIVALRQVQNP